MEKEILRSSIWGSILLTVITLILHQAQWRGIALEWKELVGIAVTIAATMIAIYWGTIIIEKIAHVIKWLGQKAYEFLFE